MQIVDDLSKIFAEEFEKVVIKEIEEDSFLSHEAFPDCKSRAKAGLDIAMEKVINTLALNIAVHRQLKHDEDTSKEQDLLIADGADVEIGTRGYWNQ